MIKHCFCKILVIIQTTHVSMFHITSFALRCKSPCSIRRVVGASSRGDTCDIFTDGTYSMRRLRYWRNTRLFCYIAVVVLVVVALKYVPNLFGYMKFGVDTEDDPLPMLKLSAGEIPVVIVDEHQDVIPWWYNGVENGLLRAHGNTLIHIDAHSDMANPENFNSVKSFKHVLKSRPSSFLPLMESNDVFIVSAIMAGLIKQVVWIKPNWKEEADDVVLANCYVGYTIMENTNERRVCVCQQGRNDSNSWEPFECYRISREGASINESMVRVTTDKCTKLRPYKFITMSENDVVKMLKLGNIKSAIFDIDEDYFGVQSGVGNFIAKGVSELIQTGLDYILGKMFCPQTIKAERTLNEKLKSFFSHFANVKAKTSIEKTYLEKELVKSAGEYMCRSPPKKEEIQYLFNLMFYLTVREMVALSKLNFCLYSKPRRTKAKESFGVCHGTIFPDHTLNQIYVGDIKDIRERGVRLNTVLTYLIKNAQLKFVTIARSLRDGYTPRDQQRFIEATVLGSLKKAMQKYGKNPRVIYDQQLYGESGW